jgi:hypothetical protein
MCGGVGFADTPTYACFFPCGGLFQQPAKTLMKARKKTERICAWAAPQ